MPAFTAAATAIIASTALTGTTALLATSALSAGLAIGTQKLVSSIMGEGQPSTSRQTRQSGSRFQLSPSTENYIPVLYGEAFVQGSITEAKLSADNKTLTYVLTLSETTQTGTYSVVNSDIYINDTKIVFTNGVAQYGINQDGTTDNKYKDNVECYIYAGSSSSSDAIFGTTTQNAYDIVPGWTSAKNMSDLVFAVIKIKYSAEDNITGIQNFTFRLKNTLTNPGDVLYDYITSTRYGANIAAAEVDTNSITNASNSVSLKSFSDEIVNHKDKDGITTTGKRYEINGLVETYRPVKENIDQILYSCGSYFVYDFIQGKWKVNINRAATTAELTAAFVFNDDNIVSDIQLSTTALEDLYNSAEIEYYSNINKDQRDFITISIAENLRNDLEPDNALRISYDLVNNNIQAERLAYIEMKQVRDDLVINFTGDYSALQLQAGEVVKITNEVFGWTDKLFRVMLVKETETSDGMIVAQITALEYNADVYADDENLQEFEPASNSDIPVFYRLSAPSTPVIEGYFYATDIPYFRIETTLPSGNPPDYVEYWVSEDNNIYKLYNVAKDNNYSAGDIEYMDFRGFDTGVYYIKCRTRRDDYTSPFTDPINIVWVPDSYKNTSAGLALTFGANTPVVEAFPNAITINQDSNGDNDFTNYTYNVYLQVRVGTQKLQYDRFAVDDDDLANNTWYIPDISSDYITFSSSSPIIDTYFSRDVKYEITGLSKSTAFFRPYIRWKDSNGEVYSLPTYNIIVNSRPYNYEAPDNKNIRLVSSDKYFVNTAQNEQTIYLKLLTNGFSDTFNFNWVAYDESGNSVSLSNYAPDGTVKQIITNLQSASTRQYIDVMVYGTADDESFSDMVRIYYIDGDTYNDNSGYTGTIVLTDEVMPVPYGPTGNSTEYFEWQTPPQSFRTFARMVSYTALDTTETFSSFAHDFETNLTSDYTLNGIEINQEDLFGEIRTTPHFRLTKDMGMVQIRGSAGNAQGKKAIFYIKQRQGVGTTQGANPHSNIQEVVINAAYPYFWDITDSPSETGKGPWHLLLNAQGINLTSAATYEWAYKSETDPQYITTYRNGPQLLLDKSEYESILNTNDEYIDFQATATDGSNTYTNVYRIKYVGDPSIEPLHINNDNPMLNIPVDSVGDTITGHDWTLYSIPTTVWGQGTRDITDQYQASSNWSIVSQTGISGASIDSNTGIITFSSSTAMTASEASIVIRATIDSINYDTTLFVKKQQQY